METKQQAWRKYFRVRDSRHPWQWAEESLTLKNSPFGKRFNSSLTPWIREITEVFPDNRNREITAMCCVQGCKTTAITVCAAWAIRFQPAPMMMNMQSDDDAKDFAKERFNPVIESIDEIASKLPADKTRRSTCSLSLPEMFLLIQGANLNNLQSKSIRWLFNDEVFVWKPGLLDHARKRTTQFWNRRIFNASTAGVEDDDLDRAFKSGDQREWYMACPKCEKLNDPKWDRIKWDENEITRPAGQWDFVAVKETVRFECEHCGEKIKHTERNHRAMNAGGKYIATNPKPKPGCISFHWNALCLSPSTCSWGDLVVEWLTAIGAKKQYGSDTLLREFVQKRLAESWRENYATSDAKPIVEDYKPTEEDILLFAIDCQADFAEFWGVIRAWSKNGNSHRVWRGKLDSWDHIAAIQKEFGVKDQHVFVDGGFEFRKVCAQAVRHGHYGVIGRHKVWLCWNVLLGRDQNDFVHNIKQGEKTVSVRRMYSPIAYGDPYLGTDQSFAGLRAPFFRWSNEQAKDILKRLRDGKGAKWTAPPTQEDDPDEKEYITQINSEVKRLTFDKTTNREKRKWVKRTQSVKNHYWDTETELIVAAAIAGRLGEGDPALESEPAELQAA